MPALRISVKLFSFLYELRPVTRAVEALISIIIGASIIMANDPAIPKAARLNFASFNRAMKAMRNGCSKAIISQVSASGPQKIKILRYVSLSDISTIYENTKFILINNNSFKGFTVRFYRDNNFNSDACFSIALNFFSQRFSGQEDIFISDQWI